MKQTFGLLYRAVAIHAVEIRRRLLAQFSGPREDVEGPPRYPSIEDSQVLTNILEEFHPTRVLLNAWILCGCIL